MKIQVRFEAAKGLLVQQQGKYKDTSRMRKKCNASSTLEVLNDSDDSSGAAIYWSFLDDSVWLLIYK